MKEIDSIDNATRRLVADSGFMRLAKDASAVQGMMRDMALAIEKSSVFSGYSKMIEDITTASRAFAFQNKPLFEALTLNAEQMRHAFANYAPKFELFGNAVVEMESRFRSQLELQCSVIDQMKIAVDQSWLKDITTRMTDLARVNFAIPEIALAHWPKEVILHRAPLLQDCFLNTAALETFHAAAMRRDAVAFPESLTLATDFVFEQAEMVRNLPPRLPGPEDTEEDQGHREEEIGAKLDIALRNIDPRLVQLRQKAWRSLNEGVAGARLAMTGIREVFDDVFRIVAPESEIEALPVWRNRADRHIAKPTRRMRLDYVLGDEDAATVDALLQFDGSIRRSQKFVHTFAEHPDLVRAQMAQLEIWIFMLIQYGRERRRSK